MKGGKKGTDPTVVLVLSQIKEQRALWDNSCSDNHNVSSRNDAWHSVATVAGIPVHQCKSMWKNVRAANLTHAKRGIDCSKARTPFLYHEQLSFLENKENEENLGSGSSTNPHRISLQTVNLNSLQDKVGKNDCNQLNTQLSFLKNKENLGSGSSTNSQRIPLHTVNLNSLQDKQLVHSRNTWAAKRKNQTKPDDIQEVVDALASGPPKEDSVTLMCQSLAKRFKRLPEDLSLALMIQFMEDVNSAELEARSTLYSQKTMTGDEDCSISDDNNNITDIDTKEPDQMKAFVENVLKEEDDKVIISAFSITLRRRDLATLLPETWLNDQVINFYLQLIRNRGESEGYPTVKVLSTFFFPGLPGLSSTSEWTNNEPDFKSCNLCLIPIHWHDHWSLAIIKPKEKTIEYFDSMFGQRRCPKEIADFIRSITKTEIWVSEIIQDRPTQDNGYDCGMFVLTYAEHLTRPVDEIKFSQADMSSLRIQVAYEIASGCLMY